MAVELILRNGTESENNSFTGANSEVTVDTTNNTLRVHDGSTPGGFSVVTTNTNDTLVNKTLSDFSVSGQITGDLIPSADITYNLGSTTNRWNDLFLSGSTIDIGGATISVVGGSFEFKDSGGNDAEVSLTANDTDDLSEGTTNLYYTDTRVQNALSAAGDLSYDPTTGTFSVTTYKSSDFDTDFSGKSTDDLTEGSNLYYTDVRSRNALSASGDLTYDSALGEFSVTTYKDADVENYLSGGTGVGFTGGTISIGQPVGTSDDVIFNDLTLSGNLTVNGTTTTLNTATLDVEDLNITVASGAVDSAAANGAGFTIDGANATLLYTASNDRFVFNKDIEATTLVGQVSDISNHDTDDLSEGTTNLYYTDTRVRNAVSASTGIDYNSATGDFALADTTVTDGTFGSSSEIPVITIDPQGRITSASTSTVAGVTTFTYDSVTADLDIGTADSSTFTATIDLGPFNTSDLVEGSNLYYTDTRARNAVSATGDLSYDSATGTFSFTERTDTEVRDLISGSTGIDYNSSTGSITLADTTVTAGTFGSASEVPVVTVDAQGRITSASTSTVAGVTTFAYNSTTAALDIGTADGSTFTATVDLGPFTTDDLSEGATNLYYTDSRVKNAISSSGDLSYDSATGTFSFTERTDQEVRDIFSATGDLSYDPAVGQFSVTTYKSSDFDTDFSGKSTDDLSEGASNLYYTDGRVDAHLTGGTGVSFSSGTISIGQPVGTSDNVTFNDLVVNGDLTISGTTTTVNTETLDIADNNITLNSNFTGSSPTENAGITVSRGTQTDAILQWDETNDYWEIASGGTTGRILTENDEGADNGLDADLLDGQQGTHYLDYNNFTNTPTIGDGTLTISGGSGLTGSGTFDANATTNASITVDHADTSSVGDVTATSNTFIDSISFDGFGHVQGVSTSTPTPPNDATITLSAGNALTGGGNFTVDQSSNETIVFDVASNSIGTDELNVAGTGAAGEALLSDGDGTFSFGTPHAIIDDDSTTDTNYYPTLSGPTSGSFTEAYISSAKLFFNPSSGTLNATTFNSLSDERQKKNIETLDSALDKTLSLRGVSFTYNDTDIDSIGVVAQEIEKVIPEVVSTGADGFKSVSYGNIVGLLIEAIKEQQNEINELKSKVYK